MFHDFRLKVARLKVENGLKVSEAGLPVEGLKTNLPFRGGFQPNRPAAVEKVENKNRLSTGTGSGRGTSPAFWAGVL